MMVARNEVLVVVVARNKVSVGGKCRNGVLMCRNGSKMGVSGWRRAAGGQNAWLGVRNGCWCVEMGVGGCWFVEMGAGVPKHVGGGWWHAPRHPGPVPAVS